MTFNKFLKKMKRGITWFKYGYSTDTWDHSYVYSALHLQLSQMADDDGFDIFVGGDKVRRELRVASEYAKRLSFGCEVEDRLFFDKPGESMCVFDFVNLPNTHPEVRRVKRGLSREKSMHTFYKKALFKLMARRIEYWWW